MNLADHLCPSTIRLDLRASNKEELIRRMVDLLREGEVIRDPGAVVAALLERERVMSTGIGGGVAIPHAQSGGASRLTVALARVGEPIEFDALDGKPVRLVFLIVGPEERGGFIRILARISRLLYSGNLQSSLLEAKTPEEAVRIIRREEEKLRI